VTSVDRFWSPARARRKSRQPWDIFGRDLPHFFGCGCGQERRRKKKAPGKELSQGGRGQSPYPGAIGRPSDALRRAKQQSRRSLFSEAYGQHPCRPARFVVRRTNGRSPPFPMQTHPLWIIWLVDSPRGVKGARPAFPCSIGPCGKSFDSCGRRIRKSRMRVKAAFRRVSDPRFARENRHFSAAAACYRRCPGRRFFPPFVT